MLHMIWVVPIKICLLYVMTQGLLLSYSNFTHLRKTWYRRVTCLVLEPSMLEWSGQNIHGNYHPNLF